MPIPAHLQGLQTSPLVKRQQNQIALQSLKTRPGQFLRNTVVVANAGNGIQTTLNAATPFAFNQQNSTARIGINAAGTPGAINVAALITPTRAYGAPNRLAPMQRFGTNGADLWITDQQTGCTVLIIDWGMNRYSMVHLLPNTLNSYNLLSRSILGSSTTALATAQNYYLRSEATSVTNATLGRPSRYIMIQSQFALNNLRLVQVIGVPVGGQWQFYRQVNRTTHNGQTVDNVEQLGWRNWDEWFYRTN